MKPSTRAQASWHACSCAANLRSKNERRALVGDELVLDAGCIESPAKGLDVGGDDIRVRASEQAQDWARVACCLHNGRGEVAGLLLRDPAVEANDSCETLCARRLVEGDPAAETEANREHGGGPTTLGRSDVGDACGDVAADVLVGRLLEMRLVLEIISAAFDSCL